MFESTRQSSAEPEHLVTQASYSDVPDYQFSRSITQAAFTPDMVRNDTPAAQTLADLSSSAGVADIRTHYVGNGNMETHGWYAANSKTAQIVKDIQDSTGRIHVTTPGTDHQDWASGFVLTDDGIMFTDRHAIINPNDQVEVTINGHKHKAQVIANDQRKDAGLLQIIPNYEGEKFKPVRLESSQQITAGTPLLAAGYALKSDDFSISPGTYTGDITLGQFANKITGGLPPGQDIHQNFKVMEANIQPGNSGELVVNQKTGGVIGAIDFALLDGRNGGKPGPDGEYGYITTSEDIQDLLNQVRRDGTTVARAQAAAPSNDTSVSGIVDRIFGRTPAPQGSPYYGSRDKGTQQQSADNSLDWWKSKIKNFSLRDLFG